MIRSLAAGLAMLPVLAAANPALAPGSVTTKDGQRNYLLFKPSDGNGLRPLIILLHGHTGSMAHTMGEKGPSPLSAWLPIASREGLLVAGLDGVRGGDGKQGWNDCRSGATGNPTTDDVAFISAVAQKLIREAHADPSRIYVMGMSNGAMMSFRAALEMRPAPAAFAAVCGSMADHGQCGGDAKRAVSALIIAGTDDPLVPFNGGPVHFYKKLRGAVVSIPQSVDFWLAADDLAGKPVVDTFPHLHKDDPTSATRSIYGQADGVQVEFIRVDGGGHDEPSISQDYGFLYHAIAGKQNRDFESAEEAWRFFKGKRAK